MLTCKYCQLQSEPSSAAGIFVKDSQKKVGYRNVCRACHNKWYKEWRSKNPRNRTSYQNSYLSKFSITVKEYDKMLEAQKNRCAICGRHVSELGKSLSVDHDHSCCNGQFSCGECIRGLLCSKCNTLIGLADDDIIRLQRAIIYLGG